MCGSNIITPARDPMPLSIIQFLYSWSNKIRIQFDITYKNVFNSLADHKNRKHNIEFIWNHAIYLLSKFLKHLKNKTFYRGKLNIYSAMLYSYIIYDVILIYYIWLNFFLNKTSRLLLKFATQYNNFKILFITF